ncbi:MAG: peptide chain release factor 1 [Actinomycetota bacterium]
MFEKLSELESTYEQIQAQLMDPEVTSKPEKLRELGKQNAELEPTVLTFRKYKAAQDEVASAKKLLAESSDPDMRELAELEIEHQQGLAAKYEEELKALLVPTDPNDSKDVLVEIKAGEGGDESALFAGELFRMYESYAQHHGWRTEILSSTPSTLGGYREITFAIKGKGAYSRMKHEAGVHRVQRVPETESQGRLHTSAVGVLVMPEAEEVDVEIDDNDLKWDVFRSSGPGGQSVNTTDSAVRLTHVPTGIVVTCQDEKSQLQNREKAKRIMRSRMLQAELDRRASEDSAARRSQVRSVDRSEKVRTYNFPQNRVTDHRVKVSVHNVPEVMGGGLDPFIDALITKLRAEQLSSEQE